MSRNVYGREEHAVADYRIVLSSSAERDLRGLPRKVEERIVATIDTLSQEPRPRGVKKLKGTINLWRIRVGDYRIIYQIDDRERLVDISHIRNRKDAYE
jgi:mRNA interferase RelE/StbE